MDSNFKMDRIAGIPIYVKDLSYYATEAFYLYSQLINNHESQAFHLSKLKPTNTSRYLAISKIREAILFNLTTLKEIQNELEPYVSPKILTAFRPNPNDDLNSYLKDFRYLKRDWSGDSASEIQLNTIKNSIQGAISNFIESSSDNALFLGAGVGRVAFDLAHLFKEVYATDKSFSMAYHFYKLIKSDVEFHEIDYKNIYSIEETTRKIKAKVKAPQLTSSDISDRISKIKYFIGDVVSLPFPDNSISAVFSVYFTDVLALKLWLPEIKRVLKDDGLFIHFGPLDYFFSDPAEMFASQEIKEIFQNLGFHSEHDQLIETTHLPADKTFVNKLYTNWLYVARKLKQKNIKIDKNSKIELKGGINYEIKGRITGNGYQEDFELVMPNGDRYEGAQSVIEIIKKIGDGIDVGSLISQVQKEYSEQSDDVEQSIKNILQLLSDRSIIRIL